MGKFFVSYIYEYNHSGEFEFGNTIIDHDHEPASKDDIREMTKRVGETDFTYVSKPKITIMFYRALAVAAALGVGLLMLL